MYFKNIILFINKKYYKNDTKVAKEVGINISTYSY